MHELRRERTQRAFRLGQAPAHLRSSLKRSQSSAARSVTWDVAASRAVAGEGSALHQSSHRHPNQLGVMATVAKAVAKVKKGLRKAQADKDAGRTFRGDTRRSFSASPASSQPSTRTSTESSIGSGPSTSADSVAVDNARRLVEAMAQRTNRVHPEPFEEASAQAPPPAVGRTAEGAATPPHVVRPVREEPSLDGVGSHMPPLLQAPSDAAAAAAASAARASDTGNAGGPLVVPP